MNEYTGLLGSLPTGLLSFPPTSVPASIPPPEQPLSIMYPFNIPERAWSAVLQPAVPLVIAGLYAVTVKVLTRYNRKHGNRAWPISKTKAFFTFVVAHNIFLAVYSAWTFIGMLGGMKRSILSPMGPDGLAGTADSFCRVHGSPGLGNSIYYNEQTMAFQSNSPDAAIVHGLPSSSETGRLWNEGLAYYGWIFYLSKFYEVLDTFIILAKGKPSSTLQTYHHAGAMMCMWAGIHYMAGPIWIFVLVNSFIHSLMYTYYTVTAFSIKVPTIVKRTLTTMQITQFILGGALDLVHSFISYAVPVVIASTTASSPESSPAASSIARVFKRMVGNADAAHADTPGLTHEIQPCIVTSGETLAIFLNGIYLAPLTYLFISFFIASYMKRSNAANKAIGKTRRESEVALVEKAGWDAARSVEREVYGGENAVDDRELPRTSGRVAYGPNGEKMRRRM